MTSNHGVTQGDKTGSDTTASGKTHEPDATESAPPSVLQRAVLGLFTTAMIVTVLVGVIVVAGQVVGSLFGAPAVVAFFAGIPSQIAFFAAGLVCVTSLINSYFPGVTSDNDDD